MKKLLVLGYILAVLVLSGMVKADPGQSQGTRINSQTGIMNVEGYLPDTCYTNPRVDVASIDETNAILTLSLDTDRVKHKMCADITVPYSVVFDLKEIPLNTGKTYAVQIGANGATSKETYSYTALPKSGSDYKINLQEFEGVIVSVSNPLDAEAFKPALKAANQIVPVVSPDMTEDLKRFENQVVRLSGYTVQTASLDSDAGRQPLFQGPQAVSAIIPVSVSR